MKRTIFCILSGLLALSAAAQARFADIVGQAYAKPERVYQYYVAHQADSIYALGQKAFSAYFTPEQFADQLRNLDFRLGQPVEASLWEQKEQMGYQIYSRTVTYPSYTARLSVIFDPTGSLAGFAIADEKARLSEGERDLTITTGDSIKLPARLTLPSASVAKGALPVVILVHGSGPSNMDEALGANAPFRDLAEGLSRRGVAVIRYDKRTRVYPDLFDEEKHAYTYDDETVDDAVSAVRLAQSLGDLGNGQSIDASRIYIVGHSLGAMLAPRIAEKSGAVKGMVLLASPTDKIRPILERQLAYLGQTGSELKEALEMMLSSLPKSYIDFDARYFATKTAQAIRLPMLILQGERDYQVTMDDFTVWRKAVGKQPGVTMKSYPLLNHLFIAGQGKSFPGEYQQPGHVAEEVMDDIAHFILTAK